MSAKTPEQEEATFSFLLGEYNRGSIDAGAFWGNVRSQLIEQHTEAVAKDSVHDGVELMRYCMLRIIDAEKKSYAPNSGGGRALKDLRNKVERFEMNATLCLDPQTNKPRKAGDAN